MTDGDGSSLCITSRNRLLVCDGLRKFSLLCDGVRKKISADRLDGDGSRRPVTTVTDGDGW